MNTSIKVLILVLLLVSIINLSYAQIFNGYLITTNKDSISSEFLIDRYNHKIGDKVNQEDYGFNSVKLLYDENNDFYYRVFANPNSNEDSEIFKVLEEGKYSYYEGNESILLTRGTIQVFIDKNYGYNQKNYVQFLGKLNYIFNQELTNKDYEGIIDDHGKIKTQKLFMLTKKTNEENYNPLFRTKSRVKPQFFFGGGISTQFWTNVQFPDYTPLPKPIKSSGYGYSLVAGLSLRRIELGLGYNSVSAKIQEGQYNKKNKNGRIYFLNVVDDINYKFNRFFANVGYKMVLGRIGLKPFVQFNYATINTSDTVKVNTQIQQNRTEGAPLFTPDLYSSSSLTLSVGANISYDLTSNSYLDFEVLTDVTSVDFQDDNGKKIMGFRNIIGLNIRYVYILDF
jgi:hypothetical protein